MEYAMIDKPAHCPQFQTDDGESESIESREFSLIKDEKTYIISLIKKDEALVFKILNYESKISLKVLSKKTKILIGKIDDAYNLFIKFFENEKVSIKNIQFAKAIKLEVSIVAPTGKEENIEFDLLYNIKNKNSYKTVDCLAMVRHCAKAWYSYRAYNAFNIKQKQAINIIV